MTKLPELQLTRTILKQLLHYDPNSGKFYRLEDGKERGGIKKDHKTPRLKYVTIQIGGKSVLAHRLAFLYMTGKWPEHIDHIDGNGTNNKWENLREVSASENHKNRALNVRNKTGIPGVYWRESRQDYQVCISIDGKPTTLAATKDFFEACCIRKSAENKYGYHPNHGRKAA